jgi:thiol-disulfide isomerase/thioredoxin
LAVVGLGLLAAASGLLAELVKAGEQAPTFSLPTLSGKREVLRIWCGEELAKPYVNDVPHVVVLSFWETKCKPCLKEMPELAKFQEKHKNDHVKVFCINIDKKGAGVVVPFVKEKEIDLPILLDPYRRTAERYGVKAVPALFVVGPDGVVRYAAVGYKEGSSVEKKLDEVLASIRAGKAAEAAEAETIGETVEVSESDEPPSGAEERFSARDKWRAVASIECGKAPDEVAEELGVDKDLLQQWYGELKETVLDIWGGD